MAAAAGARLEAMSRSTVRLTAASGVSCRRPVSESMNRPSAAGMVCRPSGLVSGAIERITRRQRLGFNLWQIELDQLDSLCSGRHFCQLANRTSPASGMSDSVRISGRSRGGLRVRKSRSIVTSGTARVGTRGGSSAAGISDRQRHRAARLARLARCRQWSHRDGRHRRLAAALGATGLAGALGAALAAALARRVHWMRHRSPGCGGGRCAAHRPRGRPCGAGSRRCRRTRRLSIQRPEIVERLATEARADRSSAGPPSASRALLSSCSRTPGGLAEVHEADHARTALEGMEGAAHGRHLAHVIGAFRQLGQRIASGLHHLARFLEEDLAHLGVVFEAGRRWNHWRRGAAGGVSGSSGAGRLGCASARGWPARSSHLRGLCQRFACARRPESLSPTRTLRLVGRAGDAAVVGCLGLPRQALEFARHVVRHPRRPPPTWRSRPAWSTRPWSAAGSSSNEPNTDGRCARSITDIRLPLLASSGTATSPSAAAR